MFPIKASSPIQAECPHGASCGRSRPNRRTVLTNSDIGLSMFVVFRICNQVYSIHTKKV